MTARPSSGSRLGRSRMPVQKPVPRWRSELTLSGAPTPGNVVKPVGVTVFSPGGGADSPETAGKAITGAAGDAWSTDVYTDPAPFPSFKSGVGLMLNLPQSTTVA